MKLLLEKSHGELVLSMLGVVIFLNGFGVIHFLPQVLLSSNEYDSGISYNWNPVPMTYEFYPICQYGYEIITTPTPPTTPATTTTTIFKSTTTDMSSCGKDCGSDSGCHGTCSRCYWSNLTERFRYFCFYFK